MCGGFNGTAIGGPVTLGGVPTLQLACSPSAASVNGDHGWGLFGTTGFFLTGNGYDARRDRAVPVHDGLHGHHGHHRHRRLRRALELQELLHLQHLHRRLHLPDLRLLGVGRRLAGAARLPRRASATARSTTPAPASSTCKAARSRSITAYLIGPRIGKYDKDGKVNADPRRTTSRWCSSARSSSPSAGSASTPAARWPAPTAASASSPSTP